MIGELGNFCLILAMFISLAQGIIPLAGTANNRNGWMNFGRSAAYTQWLLVAGSYALLTYAFYLNDFSIEYVARTSNLQQPVMYRLSGVWGGHEGSLLLWILMLSSWTALVARFSRGIPRDMVARVLAILGLVNVGFISFTLFTSNPFNRLFPVPLDGQELNPLLQDPGFLIHPPMLYMGYVGFSVVFAFAIAAMLSGKLDTAWARWSRPWTTVAWLFLTIGIVLGSWWAYYELGWGGWWFWDPVENASLMPWLVGTALMHSLAVTEKRGALKAWTVLLAILAFSLSLLGTFLVRSGVLTSVHSFAADPTRGLYILLFLLAVVGGSLLLYAMRAHRLNSDVHYGLFSKETSLLLNNIFLVVAAFMVLLGTLAPILMDALGKKISVGAPYFDFWFALLTIPLAIIVGIGSTSRWKRDDIGRFTKSIVTILAVSALVSSLITWKLSLDSFSWGAFAGVTLAVWVALWAVQSIVERLKNQRNIITGLIKIPASIWGMSVAHFGIAVMVVGITHVNSYSVEKDIKLEPGQSYEMAGYQFQFNGVTQVRERNYVANEGRFEVTTTSGKQFELKPQKRFYSSSSPMTEAAINTTLTRDVYISLGEHLGDGVWTVRLYLRSFVACIWLGGFIMALGGIIATADRRYRRPIKKVTPQQLADLPAN
ncbi:heme lyase CcmF/NrfE family subunit [Arenicella xantha]|uniref:Cytochrome c-type biogenesis protein CcmF n=1 Tax=Arenicella xantha TaxID=644221 RepID=A0A395JG06_9GAMM|nr:heme lyase CcmF/NrfE family subunit [Arenicella xantha]RBP48608.1 cytochrome c-type biogenesis protein CcmF [Arenicella xantha]